MSKVAEKIAIRDQGSLVGDIKAAGISIDDGAYFKGSIDIVRPESESDHQAGKIGSQGRIQRGSQRDLKEAGTSSLDRHARVESSAFPTLFTAQPGVYP